MSARPPTQRGKKISAAAALSTDYQGGKQQQKKREAEKERNPEEKDGPTTVFSSPRPGRARRRPDQPRPPHEEPGGPTLNVFRAEPGVPDHRRVGIQGEQLGTWPAPVRPLLAGVPSCRGPSGESPARTDDVGLESRMFAQYRLVGPNAPALGLQKVTWIPLPSSGSVAGQVALLGFIA